MYAVFFRSTGLAKAINLEGQKTITANWYATKCFPEFFHDMNIRGFTMKMHIVFHQNWQ